MIKGDIGQINVFPALPPDYVPFPDVPRGIGNEPFPSWVKQDARREDFRNAPPPMLPGETYADIITSIGKTSDAAQAYDVHTQINRAIQEYLDRGGIPVVAAPPPMVLPGPAAEVAGPVHQEESMSITISGGNVGNSILGTITGAVVDLGSQYIESRWGGPQSFINTGPTLPEIITTGVNWAANALTEAPVSTPAATTNGYPKGYLYNPATGKWVKCRRRRRKRLATVSDIRDVAALKAVLPPKLLESWIATHSR